MYRSLDMDDKTGICNEGKFPVFNALKRELTRPDPTQPTRRTYLSTLPRGFWSKRYYVSSSSNLSMTVLSYICSICIFATFFKLSLV